MTTRRRAGKAPASFMVASGLALEVQALQVRLDAIAEILGGIDWVAIKRDGLWGADDRKLGDALTLARGTPARSVKAALKRWLPKGGKGGK